jgi:hypothetical protein
LITGIATGIDAHLVGSQGSNLSPFQR